MTNAKSTSGPWIGVDPGGEGKFGIALLSPDGDTKSTSVDCVDDASDFVQQELGSEPAGVGIDAPLWWSSGRTGVRNADLWICKAHGLHSRNVQAVNSLWGSVLAQGMLFASRVRQLFPKVQITEVHPKAVLKALGEKRWNQYLSEITTEIRLDDIRDDCRDALIAAIAAREGFSGRWKRDLSRDRAPSEQDPERHWIGPVRYFWPV